jgi:ribose transport system substrate-binding protein
MQKFLALLVLSAALSGCGEKSDAKYRIAVIPKGTTHEFWKSVHAGAQKAAKELEGKGIKVEILWKGPLQENDRDGQISVVQGFITKQVSGICLAPLDSQALIEYVEEAKEAGIPVVIFDSGLDGNADNYVSYVATDNFNGGALAARRMAEALGEKGNVILLRYTSGSESTTQREEGFLETLESEFPDMNVISSNQFAGTTPESSLEKATQILQKYKDEVNGIFAVCEPNANGVLKALDEAGLAGKVKFVAFDPSIPLVEGLSTGKVDGIVLQDPVTMGYEAVMSMVNHLEGKSAKKRIKTGEYVATPDNKDEPKMKTLLAPEQFEN